MVKRLAVMLAVAALVACGQTSRANAGVKLQPIMSGLSSPVYLTSPPGDSRLFVVEKTGRILVYRSGHLLSAPFLNITSKVTRGNEQGLLSMAFDPHYRKNGLFYVSYTNVNGDSRIVRYRVEPNHPNIANPASGKILLKVDQPFENHNGGQIAFGRDGLLYIGFGDGGSEGDPNHVGQRATVGLLSKILRMNVYAKAPAAKVYAYGFRNPWRFSFDRANGDLWIGDVGQDTWEEVDKIPFGTPAGGNYGWSYYEGTHVYNGGNGNAKPAHTVFPIIQYPHSPATGPGNCSVTGGFVFRGPSIPSLAGYYVYADFCSGRIWRRHANGGRPVEMAISRKVGSISSFGQGSAGGLYVLSLNGTVSKIVP